jgi:PPOX class probable F420-dependent enzyme
MPRPPLPDHVTAILARPNPATIATVRSDGHPVSVATWYLWEGGRILVNMDEGRKRLDHLRADPRVSLTVLDGDDWYSHVSLQGRVVELAEDVGLEAIDRLAERYTGGRYPNRQRGRVNAWIEVDRWHGWGVKERAGAAAR